MPDVTVSYTGEGSAIGPGGYVEYPAHIEILASIPMWINRVVVQAPTDNAYVIRPSISDWFAGPLITGYTRRGQLVVPGGVSPGGTNLGAVLDITTPPSDTVIFSGGLALGVGERLGITKIIHNTEQLTVTFSYVTVLIGLCATCGKQWTINDNYPAYFYSSSSYAKGSYASARRILLAEEEILTCPLDPPLGAQFQAPHRYMGQTPSGGSMQLGDDRLTIGDETHPSKYEI